MHYNRFCKNVTSLKIFAQITKPTRLSGKPNTLIDNSFTNDFCKPHLAGLLITPIPDYLMQCCTIIEKKERSTNSRKAAPLATNNFKHAIVKSNVYEKLKTDPDANPNYNYQFYCQSL